MEDIKPIDFEIGDVITPKSDRYNHLKSIVVDITEKGVVVVLLGRPGFDNRIFIHHSEANLMTKCKVGTILYGNKSKEHSTG